MIFLNDLIFFEKLKSKEVLIKVSLFLTKIMYTTKSPFLINLSFLNANIGYNNKIILQ